VVERVTFHNPENGFCVLRVKARGQRDLVTIVGHAATASPPTTLEGIERYLASGMIRGIGPVYAKRLVRECGGGGVRPDRAAP
jgi:exodeoxyribonuclease V alpha subunit